MLAFFIGSRISLCFEINVLHVRNNVLYIKLTGLKNISQSQMIINEET